MILAIRIDDEPASVSLAEYLVETEQDIPTLPTSTQPGANGENPCYPGSTAYNADMSFVYMLGLDNTWHRLRSNQYVLQSKTATPTKHAQFITPDSGYSGISGVTVEAIPDNYQDVTNVTAAAQDVLTGKNIVDANGAVVAGGMPNNGAVGLTLDVSAPSRTIPYGYHNGSGKVSIA